MNVKCPCCDHKFPVSEDDVLLDYVGYHDSKNCVWENLPLLKLTFHIVPENSEKN